eukprot:2086811-Prymnesium_polylepis.1
MATRDVQLAMLRLDADAQASLARESDWWRALPRAYGGQLVGHCIVAAARQAPREWTCHSVHAHFVSAGRMLDTRYQVEPLRVGRTFALFQVHAREPDGTLVVAAT